MISKRVSATTLASAIALSSWVAASPAAHGFGLSAPDSEWIDRYLVVGMREDDIGAAIHISNTEMGADRQLLSDGGSVPNSVQQGGPNTRDVFAERWEAAGGSATETPDGAAQIFEGVDWSGNMAVTSNQGRINLSDIDLFADIGIQCGSRTNKCRSDGNGNVSNTHYFADQSMTSSGRVDNGVGMSRFDSSSLLGEIDLWKTYVEGLTANLTLDIDKIDGYNAIDRKSDVDAFDDNSFRHTFETDLDALDTDGDGLAVIDLGNGTDDFNLDNTDWIINSASGQTRAIFRINGETNFNLSNSSILMGDGYLGTDLTHEQDSNTIGGMGALFVKTEDGSSDSSDKVFNFNNVVLNGIGIWDLVTVGDGGNTEIGINNGQGCAQFIGSSIDFNDTRFNKCTQLAASLTIQPPPPVNRVPEPASILGLAAVAAIGYGTKRFRNTQDAE
ncbi:MAG: PEP-CTERM sorting domain-containing protein [Leptolyngbyaceae cyanobacterium]